MRRQGQREHRQGRKAEDEERRDRRGVLKGFDFGKFRSGLEYKLELHFLVPYRPAGRSGLARRILGGGWIALTVHRSS